MNPKTIVQSLGSESPGQAVHRLLEEIAGLCALARITEESAISILRDGYRRASVTSPSEDTYEIDPLVASQVLSEWHENVRFLTSDGAPAGLSIGEGAFSRLCEAATVKSDSNAILELLVQAAAVRREGDTVTATRRELIIGENHPAGVTRAVRMLRDLASTLNHNLTRTVGEPGRFERSVANSKLPARQIPALLAYLSVHGQSFLEDLDSWMASRESATASSTIGVGLYLFVESDPRSNAGSPNNSKSRFPQKSE